MQPLQRENIRLAATVMLVRDDPSGLQVYMVKRPGRGDFPDPVSYTHLTLPTTIEV